MRIENIISKIFFFFVNSLILKLKNILFKKMFLHKKFYVAKNYQIFNLKKLF